MTRAAITVDVEEDMPPFFKSFIGIKKGLPKILSIFDEFGIRATFFVTAEICEKFPQIVRGLARRHEVACHGFRHERLDKFKPQTLHETISGATDVIKGVVGKKPAGFRAPRLRINEGILQELMNLGYKYDSSISVWHPWQRKYLTIAKKIGIKELPASIDNTMLRVPLGMELARTQFKRDPLVIFMHPWDAIDVRKEKLQRSEVTLNRILVFRNSIGTGDKFLRNLRAIVVELLGTGAEFALMREL